MKTIKDEKQHLEQKVLVSFRTNVTHHSATITNNILTTFISIPFPNCRRCVMRMLLSAKRKIKN